MPITREEIIAIQDTNLTLDTLTEKYIKDAIELVKFWEQSGYKLYMFNEYKCPCVRIENNKMYVLLGPNGTEVQITYDDNKYICSVRNSTYSSYDQLPICLCPKYNKSLCFKNDIDYLKLITYCGIVEQHYIKFHIPYI